MNLKLQGSSHDKQTGNQLERALIFHLQWEKVKALYTGIGPLLLFAVLIIKIY